MKVVNTLNKKIVLLLLALVTILVSGYIISEKNTTGWDWEKYEKYSKFYNEINISGNINTSGGGKIGNIVRIEDFMVGMPQDTEFDKTWYFTFLYFKRGMEANRDEAEGVIVPREMGANYDDRENMRRIASNEAKRKAWAQAPTYYKQAREYRQKIEEMKPSR